ncbi:g10281 [Coccomyxa elongata]
MASRLSRYTTSVLLPADKHVPAHSRDQALRHIRQHSQELGFLQHFNLHRELQVIRSLVTSQRLAAVAAQLLGEKRVRLYQDCVFLKEPGFTPTNWHSDLPLSPLDTNSFVTAWIPLRPLKGKGDSGLEFAEGSHRDIAVHAQADGRSRDLSDRGYRIKSVGKMDLGDVSWHHGWVLHYAPPQPLDSPPRMALAVSYFADGARIRQAEWSRADCMLEDSESYANWLGPGPGKVQRGAVARHALLPLVYVS